MTRDTEESGHRGTETPRKEISFSVSLLVVICWGVSALALSGSAQAPPRFDSNRAWEHLRQLVAIGPRPAGSPAIEETRAYIKKQLAASGVSVGEQAWDDRTPTGKVHMVNLIATIPGAKKDRILISGPYHTKLFPAIQFAPPSHPPSTAPF